jgi:sec-independent protein translocase protein TatA
MPSLGPTELILILLIVIAVFGAGKLANLGGALGKGVKDFKSAMQDPNAKPEKDQVATPDSEGENSGENQS